LMFSRLYDIVIVDVSGEGRGFEERRELRRRVDEVYREVLENCRPDERPVEVFLDKLSGFLSPADMEKVIVITDLTEGQLVSFGVRKTEEGKIVLGRSTYPYRKYVFPKYPVEGEQYSFEEFIKLLKSVCPFIGTARRRDVVPG
jgi:hypothetical protein